MRALSQAQPQSTRGRRPAAFDGKGNVTFTGDGEVPKGLTGTKAITELAEPEGFVFLHAD